MAVYCCISFQYEMKIMLTLFSKLKAEIKSQAPARQTARMLTLFHSIQSQ